jgi:alkyl hydroperoxide reductase subunit F
MQYDLIIVGGGPAGAAAAVYAARKKLKTLMVVEEWGGQSTVSTDIRNWIGTSTISGSDLAANFKKHVEDNVGDSLEIATTRATALSLSDESAAVTLKDGSTREAKAVLVASGARRRQLEVPGAKEYDQKGLTYCASCDGPLFEGCDVAVIGGGNAGFETALQLLAYCKSVTLLNRGEAFRADEVTVAAAKANPNMRLVTNVEILSVEGAQFATGIRYRDAKTGEESLLPAEGIFVEIGLLPNTDWVGNAIEKNQVGQVVVDPRTQRSSHPRVWAAGDCTSGLYHQNNIAAGDAVKALEDIYLFIRKEGMEI